MSDLTGGLAVSGVAPDHIHTEMFGAKPSMTPGIAPSTRRPVHLPIGSPSLALQLPFVRLSESMGNHDSNIVDADSVD
jgi:hypothetical protein